MAKFEVGLTCNFTDLPPVVQRIVRDLPDSAAGSFTPRADVAEQGWSPKLVGAALLAQLVQKGQIEAPSEGFRFRAERLWATLAELARPVAAVSPRAAQRREQQTVARLSNLASMLLEEADHFWPEATP